jgi:hypothetical protein
MKQDERIDGVLKALTTVEAPEGLEERVLRRLAERRPVVRAGRWFVPAFVLGAVAVMVLVVEVRHRVQPVVVVPVVKGVAVMDAVPGGETHVSEARHGAPGVVGVRAVKPREVSFPAPEAPLTEQERLMVKLAQARAQEATRAVVVAEARDANAVRLTHEETLLVAVSRVRQDAVIEALDPVRRAEADARAKREFNKFVHEKDGGS